jgi:hypothetical protein
MFYCQLDVVAYFTVSTKLPYNKNNIYTGLNFDYASNALSYNYYVITQVHIKKWMEYQF